MSSETTACLTFCCLWLRLRLFLLVVLAPPRRVSAFGGWGLRTTSDPRSSSLQSCRQQRTALLACYFTSSTALSGAATGGDTTETERRRSNMEATYQQIANDAVALWESKGRSRIWIAIVGTPGSGKSTVARHVVERINQNQTQQPCNHQPTPTALVVPMDGYHYTQAEMHGMGYDMKRRGAPWTFNVTRFVETIARAASDEESISFDDYCRNISDPVPHGICMEPHHQIIFVEGLYLLLGTLHEELVRQDDVDTPIHGIVREWGEKEYGAPRSLADEIKHWQPLLPYWNDCIFVTPDRDGGFVPEGQRRLVERSLQTWTAEKTARFGTPGMTDRQAATARVLLNDAKNAALVECCQPYAGRVVETKTNVSIKKAI